jgi:hypothetical protein
LSQELFTSSGDKLIIDVAKERRSKNAVRHRESSSQWDEPTSNNTYDAQEEEPQSDVLVFRPPTAIVGSDYALSSCIVTSKKEILFKSKKLSLVLTIK